MKTKEKYMMIGKCLFFPTGKILVIGDLHLGYSEMLKERGLQFEINQFEEVIEEIKKTINEIHKRKKDIKKLPYFFSYFRLAGGCLRISFFRPAGLV